MVVGLASEVVAPVPPAAQATPPGVPPMETVHRRGAPSVDLAKYVVLLSFLWRNLHLIPTFLSK